MIGSILSYFLAWFFIVFIFCWFIGELIKSALANTWHEPTPKEIQMYFMGWRQIFKFWKIALYKRHDKFKWTVKML